MHAARANDEIFRRIFETWNVRSRQTAECANEAAGSTN